MADFGNECFLSRELSWLEFDNRVLKQADTTENPLFERLHYLSIVLTNLDEFFMIRIGSIHDQIASGYEKTDLAGLTPEQQLSAVSKRVRRFYGQIASSWDTLRGELEDIGIRIFSDFGQLSPEQTEFCEQYFNGTLYPVLTPVVIDRRGNMPFFPGKALNVGIRLTDTDDRDMTAAIQIPYLLGRLVRLPQAPGSTAACFIPCEEIVRRYAQRLFPDAVVRSTCVWRIVRNGDLDVDADEAGDLLAAVKKSLLIRKTGAVVRLETDAKADSDLVRSLRRIFDIGEREVFGLECPLDMPYIVKDIAAQENELVPDAAALHFPKFVPGLPEEFDGLGDDDNILDLISRGDIFLHHPYQSFDPIVRMLHDAARDPAVVSIKITLYRLSSDSPVVRELIAASLAGKQVIAFIESRARFDEENNIEYGAELEKARVSVIYGLPKYKTHSKILLVLRREDGLMRKYMQLGTGNYNDVTAKQYTDCSLLTARPGMTADGVEFFRSLTGGMTPPDLEYIVMAPFGLRERFVEEIRAQRRLAKEGRPAAIFAKMNSLVDKEIIKELLKASAAGVKIRLLVRGICCIQPGIPGVSDNIEVRSIVGRFLEHSRFYCFGAGSDIRVFMSSADWMTRNLNRRVELLFPLLDEMIARRAVDELELYWNDNVRAEKLCSKGSYAPVEQAEGQQRIDAQLVLLSCFSENGRKLTEFLP